MPTMPVTTTTTTTPRTLARTARRLVLLLAALALPLTLLPVTQARAAEPLAFDDLVAEVTRYTTAGPDGLPVFDRTAAETAGAPAEVLAAGEQMPAAAQMLREEPGAADGEISTLDGLPVWGNWCGPGHGSGTPADTLDTLCMRHDLCYGDRGYFDCFCDAQLKAEIDRYAHQMTGGERAMAAAVKAAFSVGICIP